MITRKTTTHTASIESATTYAAPVARLSIVRESAAERPRIRCPRDVYNLIAPLVADEEREHFYALLLDTKNNVKGVYLVSLGDLDSAIVHPREVFRAAIVAGAASIIVAHNHPTGDPTPSPEDNAVTRRLNEAGELLGIELRDHVIIGRDRWASLKERGIF